MVTDAQVLDERGQHKLAISTLHDEAVNQDIDYNDLLRLYFRDSVKLF